jgi:hypothetical protein
MEKVFILGQMEKCMKESGLKALSRASVFGKTKLETTILVSGIMD